MVSIIIPHYNRSEFLTTSLESILNQSCEDWEAIIVDDGSTDNSKTIIQTFTKKDKRFVYMERNRLPKGPSTCRNLGVEKAKGDYLIFFDSDDILAPHCVEHRLNFMQSNSHCDLAVFNLEIFKNTPGDQSRIFNKYAAENESYLEMFLNYQLPWQTTCPVWKKSFFQLLGGFDENMIIMEDPELHTRALIYPKIQYQVLADSPADCFYRMSSFDAEKSETFFERSIKGRIVYLKKMASLIEKSHFNNDYKRMLMKKLWGTFYDLMKSFLIAKVYKYKNEFTDIVEWAKQKKLVNRYHLLKLRLILNTGTTNSKIIKTLHLKGILYKWF